MKPHILLIDDSEAVQAAISSVLSDRDYILTTASSGTEGLSYVERQRCDLVLLDYTLPDADGLTLLRTITEKKPDIPVIMVTGSGSERVAVTALKSGASDYVVKSSDFISKLPHVVRDNLDKYAMRRRNRELESQLRESYRQLKQLNKQLEAKVESRTEELERAYQLSNELMAKAVDSNMQLAELYSEVDESRRKLDVKIRELSLLNDIAKIMTSTLDQDTLLQVAIDSVHQELGVEHCAILLLNEEIQRFQVGVSRGTPDDLLLAARSIEGEQELLNIVKKGEPLLVQDVEFEDRFRPLADDFPGIECFILVPLRVQDLEIGVFTVYGYDVGDTFTKSDLEFVSSLASQASIAFANIILTNQRIQEEQMGMIGKMTNYVMHDLKNSLKSIRSSAELVGHDELNVQERKELSQKIVNEIDWVVGMTQELLEFSCGQHGVLKLQTYTVQEFVQDIISTMESGLTGQNILIRPKLEYTGNIEVDVEKMKRVFMNIADNAWDAMSDGGVFTIASQLADDTVHFELTDEGCGIAPDLQVRMFEPFVSEGKPDGSGLGMTIVKKICDEHRAHVEVRSVVGKGTTIRISLPRIHQTWEDEEFVKITTVKN